jgi:hypothetical protein
MGLVATVPGRHAAHPGIGTVFGHGEQGAGGVTDTTTHIPGQTTQHTTYTTSLPGGHGAKGNGVGGPGGTVAIGPGVLAQVIGSIQIC